MKITQYIIRKSRINTTTTGEEDSKVTEVQILEREFLCHEEGTFETRWLLEKDSNPKTLTIFSSEDKAKTWMKINDLKDGAYRIYEIIPFDIKLDFKIPKKKEEPKATAIPEVAAPPTIHAAVPAFP